LATTASTKSGKKAKKEKKAGFETKNAPQATSAVVGDIPNRVWWISVIAIMLIAAVLRLYDLNLVPLHHDEGVNGNFLVRLVRQGEYQYDPRNYHGPTLYYFAALVPWILRLLFGASVRDHYGLTTVMIRLVPALFGLGTIGLIFMLRRRLGTIATLSAALLLAVSPGAVYLSRYFIHETHFVFFTLAIVVFGLRFYDTRNPTWLILASASAALLFATKETALISMGVLLIAFGLTHVYRRLFRKARAQSSGKSRMPPVAHESAYRRFINEFGITNLVIASVIAIAVFLFLNVLFYSSFFRNSQGIYDALKTFEVWTKTGRRDHIHPPFQYLIWLVRQEAPLLFLGSIGGLLVVLKPKNSMALFSALWSFGLIAAYSLIPYKTPWLMLSFIVPLALIAGHVIQVIFELERGQVRILALALVIAVGVSAYQTIDLNFINYDNDNTYYVYVYAHTRRGTLDLVRNIEQVAAERDGEKSGITIVSPDYWPLPWYLRNYSGAAYFGQMTATTEPMIIAREDQRAQVEANFGELYRLVPSTDASGSYELRPGVRLLLYVRRNRL
jgi:uncharacterized protein (TIGR03663 family)